MKIAIAIWEYSRAIGLPRHAVQIATAMNRRGHSVTVFAQEVDKTPQDEGIAFERLQSVKGPDLVKMWIEPWLLTKKLRRIAGDFDHVVVIGMPCLASAVMVTPGVHRAWYVGLLKGDLEASPLRRLFEAVRPFHWPVLFWETMMVRGGYPRLYVVPSTQTMQNYVDLFGLEPSRMKIIPNGVETEELRFSEALRESTRAELGIAPGSPLVVSVAARIFQKGLDLLVDGFEKLQTDVPWHAAIAGVVSPRLERLCRPLVDAGRMTLLGPVPSERIRALFCAADVLVFPSRFEPWGLVVTEALATGLPVLCSARAGSKDAIVEGTNGILIRDLSNGTEIARLLEKTLAELDSYDRQEIAASVMWLDHHRLAGEFEATLEALSSSPQSSPS